MKMLFRSIIFLLSLLMCLSVYAQNKSKQPSSTKEVTNKIKWLTFEQAEKLHEQEPKPLLIDFYTSWCGWCKVMDRKTYANPNVIKYINDRFYPVKFNAEQKASVTFNGKTYKYDASKRAHAIAIEFMQSRMSYPTTVYMMSNKQQVAPVPGYLKPTDMERVLKFFEEGVPKGMSWSKWGEAFKPTW